jgi:hypothetical protein
MSNKSAAASLKNCTKKSIILTLLKEKPQSLTL